jgi:hypothetical protein
MVGNPTQILFGKIDRERSPGAPIRGSAARFDQTNRLNAFGGRESFSRMANFLGSPLIAQTILDELLLCD